MHYPKKTKRTDITVCVEAYWWYVCVTIAAQFFPVGVICGMGDVIAQQAIERRGRGHSWERTAKLSAIGFVFIVS